MKKNLFRVETILVMAVLLMLLLIGLVNPAALNQNTLFNMLRSFITVGIFGMGVLVVLVSGGMDVSFTYIAPVAAYLAVRILVAADYSGSVIVPFLLAALFGAAMGAANGLLIARYDFPSMIVTLGTGAAFQGLTVFFVGATHITALPGGMLDMSRTNLATVQFADGSQGGINITIVITVAVIILVWFLLNKTIWGRGLYALGGSKTSAYRVGFPVGRLQFSLYTLVGCLAGITGVIYMSLNRQATPHLMVGTELDVIAAVVLGGASVFGGRGTVMGAVLGIALVTILNNSLILIGIPTQWQKAAIGVVILTGTALPIVLGKLKRCLK